MITRSRVGIGLTKAGILLGLAATIGVGIVAGRVLGAQSAEVPPAIQELREAPNFYVLPARRPQPLGELVKTVDAVGRVRVESTTSVKDHTAAGPVAGIETSWGHVDVKATVLDVYRGSAVQLSNFAFEAVFELGTDKPAVSAVNPPLRVGEEYVVFVDDGRVYFPGGTYRVYAGKVWNIGHWIDPTSREYPADLSGLTIAEAGRTLLAAASQP